MSATSDAFARVLDVLAETLDERGTSGDALAARVHLSRYHFDRLVSAAAGEPPAALRRRVLLERAAYRLLTTSDHLLEVGLDAGYASHEAFTRAFTRAYGEPPSRWRVNPTGFRLEAPSRIHFHPPGSLWLPTDRKVTGMDLLTRMVVHHIWLLSEMLTRADRLPDDVLDRPIEISVEGIDDTPTIRSLLARLVGQLAMWDAATHSVPYDLTIEQGVSIAELRRRLAEAGPAFLGQIREIVDGADSTRPSSMPSAIRPRSSPTAG